TISGSAEFSSLKLNVQYDDGFVAYLNGEEVARVNAPDPLAANSTATGTSFDSDAVTADTFNLDDFKDLLVVGPNVLAIQALNVSASNPDLLIRAELIASDVTAISDQARYFVTSSPNGPNGQGTQDLGPIITNVTNTPAAATAADPVIVSAKVTQAFSPIAANSVVLHYRRMYNAESTLV